MKKKMSNGQNNSAKCKRCVISPASYFEFCLDDWIFTVENTRVDEQNERKHLLDTSLVVYVLRNIITPHVNKIL